MFLCLLSSDEDRIDKSPNLFGCDFQCIQKGLGFLFEFHIFFVYHFIPLLPDGNRLFCGSQFFFQTLVVSIGDNAIDRIAFECVAFIRCQRDIVSECGFFAHYFNVLHCQRNGLCRLGFLLQRFQFLFLFCCGSFGILQILFCLCHLPGHSFQPLLLCLYLELRHRQMFLGAATLSTLQIGISGNSHEMKKVILQHTVG